MNNNPTDFSPWPVRREQRLRLQTLRTSHRHEWTASVLTLVSCLLLASSAQAEPIVAFSANDSSPIGIQRFNVDGTSLSDFDTFVGFQSLDFDTTTGTLHGLWQAGGSARLASFTTGGDLIGDVILSGVSLTADSGADIAVHDGIVALNENDGSSVGLRRFATDGTVLSDFNTFVGGYQSLDFDTTTGTLHGLWRAAGSARLASFTTDGDLIGDAILSGVSLTSDLGADIAVHSMSSAAVPEPSTFAITGFGLAFVAWRRKRNS